LVPTSPGRTNVVLVAVPCHYRASHSSRDRSRADNHGQCNGGRDLRRLPSDQLAIILELALQAGGRLVAGMDWLAVPGRLIGPWWRRTGAPEVSATRWDRRP